MTGQQYLEAKPTRDTITYHQTLGCDIRHKTNRALDRCETAMERVPWAADDAIR